MKNVYPILLTLQNKAILWVVISLFLVSLPHSIHLPIWMTLLIVSLLFWRLYIEVKQFKLPSKFILFLLASTSFSAVFFEFSTIAGKTAGSGLLLLLVSIKLLESNKNRDLKLITNLCFFILSINFLFSQSIAILSFAIFTVPILLITMMRLTQQPSKLNIKEDFKMAIRLCVFAFPLMLILFFLFPRLPGPLWQLPSDKTSAQTGLSDRMTPGNISKLIQSNAVAFRVKFKDKIPAQPQLYWRALVLWYFDGENWEIGQENLTKKPLMESRSKPIHYTITIEPHHKKWIFALDMPYSAPAGSQYNNNYLLRANTEINRLKQYTLNATLDYRISNQLSAWEQSAGLKQPLKSNPKTRQLAQQWLKDFKTPERIINQALKLFNQEDFFYTLQPPLTLTQNPVDDFLFINRRGFCQHYASSFALLMRAAGIPARIVLGYQGGTLNPFNNMLTVRQSDAHAWVEVWIKDKGWIRIDPTAAVSPSRIEKNINTALTGSGSRPLFMRLNNGIFQQLNFYWGAVDNGWKQWIVGYNAKKQKNLLGTYLKKDINSQQLISYLLTSLALMTLLISLFIFKPFKRSETDPVQKLYEKFCLKFKKNGLIKNKSCGPKDFTDLAIQKFPHLAKSIDNIMRIFIRIQYQSNQSPKQLKQLKKLIHQFKVTKKAD